MAQRALSPEFLALIAAGKMRPAVFLLADFPSGVRRLWTGQGNYVEDDSSLSESEVIWEGIGGVVTIDQVQESVDVGVPGLKVTLDGLDSSIVNSLLTEDYQGRRAEMRLGFWDSSIERVVFADEPVWRGTLDTDDSEIAQKGTRLTVMCEHRMADILRKREYRYTNQDQQLIYPEANDTGLAHMEEIQDLSLPWGRTQ